MQESKLSPFLRLKNLIREYEELKDEGYKVSLAMNRFVGRLKYVTDEIVDIAEQHKITINPSPVKIKRR